MFNKISEEPLWVDFNDDNEQQDDDRHIVLSLDDFTKNKRDSKIEKEQLSEISNAIDILKSKYKNIQFNIIDQNHSSGWYITDSGKIYHTSKRNKNPWFDSKTFDCVVELDVDGRNYDIFFVLKGCQNQGGHQGNVLQEMGLYMRQMNKNEDDNVYFIFQLDGDYIESKFNLAIGSAYDCGHFSITNSGGVLRTLEKYINKVCK